MKSRDEYLVTRIMKMNLCLLSQKHPNQEPVDPAINFNKSTHGNSEGHTGKQK